MVLTPHRATGASKKLTGDVSGGGNCFTCTAVTPDTWLCWPLPTFKAQIKSGMKHKLQHSGRRETARITLLRVNQRVSRVSPSGMKVWPLSARACRRRGGLGGRQAGLLPHRAAPPGYVQAAGERPGPVPHPSPMPCLPRAAMGSAAGPSPGTSQGKGRGGWLLGWFHGMRNSLPALPAGSVIPRQIRLAPNIPEREQRGLLPSGKVSSLCKIQTEMLRFPHFPSPRAAPVSPQLARSRMP